MNVRLVRNGELPPGVVDGYCTACSGDVLVSAPDYACPTCETPVHPDSLPRDARLSMLAGESAAKAVEAVKKPRIQPVEGQSRVVTMRATPAARQWSAATDKWLAEAEREAAAAEAEFAQSKARRDAARQDLHRVRQLRELVQVEAAPALTGPKPEGAPREKALHSGRHALKGPCVRCQKMGITS